MVTMGSRLQSPAQPERVIIVSWSWCSSICRKTRASSFLAPAAMPQVPMWKLILTRGGPFSRERWRDVLSLIASRSVRLDTCIDHGQVGWMPAFPVLTEGGEGGNGLQTWSQSRPCNNIILTRKPRPVPAYRRQGRRASLIGPDDSDGVRGLDQGMGVVIYHHSRCETAASKTPNRLERELPVFSNSANLQP